MPEIFYGSMKVIMTALRKAKALSIITYFLIISFMFFIYIFYMRQKEIKGKESQPFDGEKLVHIDLKGAPPLVSYYKKFFPYIKALGATGVLMEYEDMFYYDQELEDIRALNAYTLSEIETILNLAAAYDLQVIPLIQTFGHFEFVLKLEKYRELREIDEFPQVLCPTHEKVHSLIYKMIDQVMKAHPKSNYIHIGADEVMLLGQCKKCERAKLENKWSDFDLYLNHVKTIALYINKTYPGIRPIIWGDMLVATQKKKIKKLQISALVDLMVWKYVPNVSDYITDELLKMYAELFKDIWIASAFKGATGVSQVLTDADYHLGNHAAWMDIVKKWRDTINFKGIALTGWQRYDHFSELCELLPVAIPSLALNLNYISDPKKELYEQENITNCDDISNSGNDKCDFPGFKLYRLVNLWSSFSLSMQNQFPIRHLGWFSIYNIVHKFSNPYYVIEHFKDMPVKQYLDYLLLLEKDLNRALSEVYDQHTVKEWLMTHLTPLRIHLEALWRAKKALLKPKVWPRRPLVNNLDNLEKAAREICTDQREFGCGLLLV